MEKEILEKAMLIEEIGSETMAMCMLRMVGNSTLFANDCNDGRTLPFRISKDIVIGQVEMIIAQLEILKANYTREELFEKAIAYWHNVIHFINEK